MSATSKKRKLLVVGGQFAGTFAAREMRKAFDVTVVDAKEFFEYTPGILRAYVKPKHYTALCFLLEPVLVKKMGVKFILGEVKKLEYTRGQVTIEVKHLKEGGVENLSFDYCIIATGCSFGPFHKWGESLWFPTIHEDARGEESSWGDIDERYLEGRKKHIMQEYNSIQALASKNAKVLVVGAGFIGVEWVTELQYFFPKLDLTIIDFLPRCLGPLPESAANYCAKYMSERNIKEIYCKKYDPTQKMFWAGIKLPEGADKTYVCIGVKASNRFMPQETLSDKGPGGGGWIHFNMKLQVTKKPQPGQKDGIGDLWGDGKVFAVGDCNFGCVGTRDPDYKLQPIPKICYASEEQAYHACLNIGRMDVAAQRSLEHPPDSGPSDKSNKEPRQLMDTWWPWGAGMFATSLGPRDACSIAGANANKNSGWMVSRWKVAAFQKNFIEKTKVWECQNGCVSKMIWHYVHHMPVNLWGKGPLCPGSSEASS